jgi:D-tyrosyl-tRNA(Tyr) deacylase
LRAVVQRVSFAKVVVAGETTGEIGDGFLVLLGVGHDDDEASAKKMAGKIARLRVFKDADDKMNLSLLDTGGGVLAVSQFTLLADASRGNRPSFAAAANPGTAEPLYDLFCREMVMLGVRVERGVFGAHMDVTLNNSGPVTIIVDVPAGE